MAAYDKLHHKFTPSSAGRLALSPEFQGLLQGIMVKKNQIRVSSYHELTMKTEELIIEKRKRKREKFNGIT